MQVDIRKEYAEYSNKEFRINIRAGINPRDKHIKITKIATSEPQIVLKYVVAEMDYKIINKIINPYRFDFKPTGIKIVGHSYKSKCGACDVLVIGPDINGKVKVEVMTEGFEPMELADIKKLTSGELTTKRVKIAKPEVKPEVVEKKLITCKLLSPDNEVVEITDLESYCKDKNLDFIAMEKLARKEIIFYNAYKPV